MCCCCSLAKCCREQFKARKFLLEHDDVSDFYLSACQARKSALALLCVRAILFVFCAMIMVSSIVLTSIYRGFKFWFIYLTRWGLIGITLTTGTAVVISCIAYFKGSIETNAAGLPWYVKVHWALFNISVSLAFFVTIYYHAFLSVLGIHFAETNFLDFCVHGANSLIMLVQLMTSRHPVHILHFYWPLLISILYTIFSVIYYYCGGKDPYGHSFIYPILDWDTPDVTAVAVMICFTVVPILHLIVFALASLRDCATRGCRSDREIGGGVEPSAA